MPSSQRVGLETAKTRAALIEAAVQMGRSEGYATISARRLAEKIGLKRQIVHYYFRTIEDLLVAVAHYEFDRLQNLLEKAITSSEPVRAMLEVSTSVTTMAGEFAALALHSKVIRDELKRDLVKLRALESDALSRYLEVCGIQSQLPPVVTAFVLQSVARSMAFEAAIGVSFGHAETKTFVEGWLRALAGDGVLPRRSRNENDTLRLIRAKEHFVPAGTQARGRLPVF